MFGRLLQKDVATIKKNGITYLCDLRAIPLPQGGEGKQLYCHRVRASKTKNQYLAFVVNPDEVPQEYRKYLLNWYKRRYPTEVYRKPVIVVPYQMGLKLAQALNNINSSFVIYVVEESDNPVGILEDGRTMVRHTDVVKNKKAQEIAYQVYRIYK